MPVTPAAGNRKPRSGQLTNVDTTGQALSTAGIGCVKVSVQNDHDNTVDILVGGSLATAYFRLVPGESLPFYIGQVDYLFVKAASGTALKVSWIAEV